MEQERLQPLPSPSSPRSASGGATGQVREVAELTEGLAYKCEVQFPSAQIQAGHDGTFLTHGRGRHSGQSMSSSFSERYCLKNQGGG